jgi:hypothetical protein
MDDSKTFNAFNKFTNLGFGEHDYHRNPSVSNIPGVGTVREREHPSTNFDKLSEEVFG